MINFFIGMTKVKFSKEESSGSTDFIGKRKAILQRFEKNENESMQKSRDNFSSDSSLDYPNIPY